MWFYSVLLLAEISVVICTVIVDVLLLLSNTD